MYFILQWKTVKEMTGHGRSHTTCQETWWKFFIRRTNKAVRSMKFNLIRGALLHFCVLHWIRGALFHHLYISVYIWMCLQLFTASPSILLSYQYCILCLHLVLVQCWELMLNVYDRQFNILTDINPSELEIK